MPWKDTRVMDLKLEFVMRALREAEPFGELCRAYGISRKTGYKWKARFLAKGFEGLEDRSRRPSHSPTQLAEDVVCELVRIKKDHLGWGPRKIRDVYARKHPGAPLPSESTVKRILDKAGLVQKRRRRKSGAGGRIEHRITPEGPNDLWTVDFKGWWYTNAQERCEPLTVRDGYSRFILCANPLENAKGLTVRREFERLFERYGLPRIIRSDNGPPFASRQGPLGLTKLAAWWLANGIALDRIAPGRPDQNGAHERMHRDLAFDIERNPSADLVQQRVVIETWRHSYNTERPHEALGMRVPAELYRESERPWDQGVDELDYPAGILKRKVAPNGHITIEGVQISASTTLAGWHVGLQPGHAPHYRLWFAELYLGDIDMGTEVFKPIPAPKPQQENP